MLSDCKGCVCSVVLQEETSYSVTSVPGSCCIGEGLDLVPGGSVKDIVIQAHKSRQKTETEAPARALAYNFTVPRQPPSAKRDTFLFLGQLS